MCVEWRPIVRPHFVCVLACTSELIAAFSEGKTKEWEFIISDEIWCHLVGFVFSCFISSTVGQIDIYGDIRDQYII